MSLNGIGVLPKRIQNPVLSQNGQQPPYHDPNTGKVGSREKTVSAFKARIDKRTADVVAHEEAHLAAAGRIASGGPSYDTKTFDVAGTPVTGIVGGHVNVKVPGKVSFKASKEQIARTMKDAELTIASAEAPLGLGGDAGRLSDADKSVAAAGRAVLASAQAAFGKREALDAKLAQNGQALTGQLTDQQVAQAQQVDKKPGNRVNFFA